jgi:hypothetical protein
MKKIQKLKTRTLVLGITALLVLGLLISCPTETEADPPALDSLALTAWTAGEAAPVPSLAFLSDTKVQAGDSFKAYTYQGNNTGAVTGLGDFTLSQNAQTLTLTSGSGALQFTRQSDLEPPDSLVNTKWAWASLTLEFTSPVQAKMGQDTYVYTYQDEDHTGILEELGVFSFDEAAQTLNFTNYKGRNQHLVFKTQADPALVDTRWRWGNSLLEFTSSNKAAFNSRVYTYTYDDKEKIGSIKTLGSFTLNDEEGTRTITLQDYKGYNFSVLLDESLTDTPVTLDHTLKGTEWFWNSQYGGYMVFVTDTQIDGGRTYTWDPATRKGTVEVLGPFLVTQNDQHITFTNIKGYGHTAEFERRE